VPIATQINQFVGLGREPNAFYSVWGGANDIFFQLGLASATWRRRSKCRRASACRGAAGAGDRHV
jgi:hypothetical protein